MLEFMLDTNICIGVLRQRSDDLAGRFFDNRDKLAISAVVLAELQFGVLKSKWSDANRRNLGGLIAQIQVLPLTAEVAPHYAELRAHLEVAGTPIGANDLLIGAHARSLDLTLVTNNRREFERLPGLRVEDWL